MQTVQPHQPSQVAPIERRTAHRAEVRTAVTFQSRSNFYTGLTGDISSGGLFVQTYTPPPVGSSVELEFTLPDGGEPIRAVAEVRWVREDRSWFDTEPGMGLKFRELDSRTQGRIAAFAEQRDTIYWDEEDLF